MTTLLYGEEPGCDVAPGNRADTADVPIPAPAAPFLASPSYIPPVPRRTTMQPLAASPMRQVFPTPSPDPWVASAVPAAGVADVGERDIALPSIMFGVAAAAAVFAGLAVVGVALAWSQSLGTVAEIALMIVGGYLMAVGIGYVVSTSSRERQLMQPNHA